MPGGTNWTETEALAAFRLYCSTPFGRLHQRNPEIIELAAKLGRTPSAGPPRPDGATVCSHGWSGEHREPRNPWMGSQPREKAPEGRRNGHSPRCRPAQRPVPQRLSRFIPRGAFDRGLITLDDDPAVVLGPSLRDPEAGGTLAEHLAGWEGRRLRLPERFEPEGEAVRWHRGRVFESA